MDASTLDVLHDARDQDVGTVTDGVDLDFLAHDIFVDQDRMLLGNLVDDADEFDQYRSSLMADLHALSAKHVGRTYQNRIAQRH